MQLKEKRQVAGLTQEKAAELLGIGRTAISMWEIGESMPRADMLPKIAALYGCTVDELLADTTT